MNLKIFNWKLIVILLLAVFLRFYQLGQIPPSLDWDEVSLAYNAQSILETGHDEYGNFLPITIRSFNDYKPALYTYSLIPFLAIFGKSALAIRLPSALGGVFTVLFTFLLVRQLFPKKKYSPYLASLLLAISPWHLQFSRIGFEANLSLCFFVAGILYLSKTLDKTKYLPLSALSFSLSMMAYHSTKIIIPIFLVCLSPLLVKKILKDKKALIISSLIAGLVLILIGRTVQLGIGQSRLSSVSILTIDDLFTKSRQRIEADGFSFLSRLYNHRQLIVIKEFIGSYTDHYNLNFWFINGDSNERHQAISHGLLYWWTLPFLFFGMVALFKSKNKIAKTFIFTQFLIAPLASALTAGTPNSVRAIFFLPTFQIFTALGIFSFISWLKKMKPVFCILYSVFFVMFMAINITTYFHNYYIHTPSETSPAWQYGYRQTVEYTKAHQSEYERVIFTTAYDQPYIYFLWFGNHSSQIHNPGDFNQKYQNIDFREINWYEDIKFKNTLLIASPQEVKDSNQVIWQTSFLDGSPAFVAIKSQN